MKHTNRLVFALLAAAALIFAAGCSSDSDSDDSLAGTTWSASLEEQTVATLKFASDGTVNVWIFDVTKDDGEECDYSVSGSTVTISQNDVTMLQLTYSSGQLTGSFSGVSLTFTKS